MDFGHPYPHSKNTFPLRPLKQSRNGKRECYLQIAKSTSVEHSHASNLINSPKTRETQIKRGLPSTATLDCVKICQNWEDGLADKQTAETESAPLQRWLNECPRDESWNPLGLLDPFYELSAGPEINAEYNIDAESNIDGNASCDATYDPTVQWGHVEVPSEEDSSVLESSEVQDLKLNGMGSGADGLLVGRH